MAMSDARKRLIMWEVLGAMLLFIVVWIVIQLAIGVNHAAAERERPETCYMAVDYGDCMRDE